MRRSILAILAAVSLGFGPGEAQSACCKPQPYFFCSFVDRGFPVAPDTKLYGFVPIWIGDGTGYVFAGYEVDLDQCSDWIGVEVY